MSGRFVVYDGESDDVVRLVLVDEGDGVLQLQAVDDDGDIVEDGCLMTFEYGEPVHLFSNVNECIGLPLTEKRHVRTVRD